MSFFTRPDLSNTQFKQLTGSTLTLSGTTNFQGKLKSKNVEIDASITGATTGDVMTYIGGGKIKLSAGGGSSAFNGNRTVTRDGIPNVNVGGTTLNQFMEGYFFPAIAPGASLTGGGTRMFGNNTGFTANYVATRNTLPIASIKIDGVAFAITNGGNTQSGATGRTITSANVNQTYTLEVKDSSNNTTNAQTSITFRHKRYYYADAANLIGQSNATISTNVNLHDPGDAEFSTTKVKSTFPVTLSNQFFYYVLPVSFGVPSFVINGLPNTDFSSQTFTFTNPYGYVASFQVWRSNNLLTGTFNFSIS